MTRLPTKIQCGGLDCQEFQEGVSYTLLDDQPVVLLLVREPLALKGKTDARLAKCNALSRPTVAPSTEGIWWELSLGRLLSRERRFGKFTLQFNEPVEFALKLVVVPTKLLSVADVVKMVADISDEFKGIDTWWDDGVGGAWADCSVDVRPSLRRLVEAIESELVAALQIRQHPFSEPAWNSAVSTCCDGLGKMPIAENMIVSHWAARRLAAVQNSLSDIETDNQLLSHEIKGRRAPGRLDDVSRRISMLSTLKNKMCHLRRQLTNLIDLNDLRTQFPVGPLLQRDSRSRLLLRAFAPNRVPRISDNSRSVFGYPPRLLNDIFELWAATWIASQLRSLGIQGSPSATGQSRLRRATWQMIGPDDVVVSFHYSPDSQIVDATQASPPRHERQISKEAWLASRLELDQANPFFCLSSQQSPDYAIRVFRGRRRSLLVGDASLADPAHHAGEKVEKVGAYGKDFKWLSTSGTVIPCNSLGTFLVLPATQVAWSGETTQNQKFPDVLILFLKPTSGNDEARQLLLQMFQSIIRDLQ